MRGIILGLLAAAGFVVARKVATATKLKFYPRNVKLTGSGILNQKLWLIAEVVNPTYNQLTINNVFLTIYADTTLIGRVEYNTPLVIGGNGSTEVNIPIKLHLGAIAFITSKYLIKGIKPTLKIVGSVNSGGANVPIETTVDLTM